MDLVHNGGGGFGLSPTFHIFFVTFNEKNISKKLEKNDKTMVKKKHSSHLGGGAGGGVLGQYGLSPSKCFFVFVFLTSLVWKYVTLFLIYLLFTMETLPF